MLKRNISGLLALFLCITSVQAQTVDEVVEKHVAALGGKEKLSKLKSLQIDAVVTVNSFEVKSTTTVVQNKGVRSEQEIQGMKIVQGFDGTTAWMINPMMGSDKATKLPAEQNDALKGQMDLTGLYNYKDKGYDVALEGEDVLDGAPVFVLQVKMPDGSSSTNFISKSTYYTLKTLISAKGPDGNPVQTTIYSSDYKDVDGYITPYSIEIESEGMPGKIVTKVTSAKFNVEVDPSIFAFPGDE
jgi:hypothetical protein